MKIDRSNYEVWIIDWFDGNLNNYQVEQLKAFLNENPDLGEEFDGVAAANLKPSLETFPQKERLKKTDKELSPSQFEYLCVAYFENDLTAVQKEELEEYVLHDPEKKKTFTLIGKTRLSALEVSYKFKKQLLKRTPAHKVIRLSVIGLSAAASVALLITTWIMIPDKQDNNLAQTIVLDSSSSNQPAETANEPVYNANRSVVLPASELDRVDNIRQPGQNIEETYTDQINQIHIIDSVIPVIRKEKDRPFKVLVSHGIKLITHSVKNDLIKPNYYDITPVYYEERSNIEKFLAKNIRGKILKNESSEEIPLKGYEIAEAGMTGLNKLLGWEMALEKNNDENGELTSVYFSSRVLKFNAPIKKQGDLQ